MTNFSVDPQQTILVETQILWIKSVLKPLRLKTPRSNRSCIHNELYHLLQQRSKWHNKRKNNSFLLT